MINMAIGLQNAFDVGVSDFMIELSEKYINGEIELKDMEGLIKKHYDKLKKIKIIIDIKRPLLKKM